MNDDNDLSGNNSLGEAANRYVTFQIVSSIIGGVIFLIVFLTVFLPMFNRANQSSGFSSSPVPVMSTGPGGPATGTVTIDGRPATPQEKAGIEQHVSGPHP